MLKFALKNIVSLVKEYKSIFAIFFSVFSLVAVSLIYLHSFNVSLLEDGKDVGRDYRTYSIFGNMEKEQAESFVKEAERNFLQNKMQSVLLYIDNTVELEGLPINLAAVYGETDQKQIALECGSAEMNKDKKEIILNDIFYMSNQRTDMVNDQLKVNEEEFILKGIGHIGAENVDALITMEGLQALDLSVYGIVITFENRLTKEESEQLQEIFGLQYEVNLPPLYNAALSRQFLNRFLLIFVLILMATVNIMGLYRYIVLRRKKEFLIYKIYGISSYKLLAMILIETIVLITFGFLLGIILFVLVRILSADWLSVSVSPAVFLQTYAIELLCSIAAVLPVLHKIRKKSVFSEYVKEDIQ